MATSRASFVGPPRRSTLKTVRWIAWLGSMLAVVGCTSPNPAFEGTGETVDVDPDLDADETTSTGTTGTTHGSTHGSTRGDTSAAATEASSTSDASGVGSEDVPPWTGELCEFDLFAINELGDLYALDPDAEAALLLLSDPRIASWALATDSATGMLYASELAAPNTVWRVDPFGAAIEDEPLAIEAMELINPMARATVHPLSGELWLGTDQTHRFLSLHPTDGTPLTDDTLGSFAWGGDMVFLEDGCAVVPALDGWFYQACFPSPKGRPLPPPPLVQILGAQFTGVAIDEADRMWLSTADPANTLILVERDGGQWTATTTISYDMIMNDLAPLIAPPGC